MKSYLVVFLLLASFNTIHGTEFDHYVFAQQWSGVFCEVNDYCLRKLTTRNTWTIHGLWPSDSDGSSPQFCPRGAPFDFNKIKSMESQLNEKWPSYSSPSKEFWKHEWKKHGKCAARQGMMIPESTYFKKALDLNNQLDIFRALKKSNIVPSYDKLYKVSDIKQALERAYGVTVNLSCKTKDKKAYITESRICLDLNFRPINCHRPYGNCKRSGQVKYLPSGSRSMHALHLGSIQPLLFALLFLLVPFWLS
ncbi:ribonuclease DdI [Octopus sinensis]|uniref:Ribonuclease DdI n=1 Tax=Octopus sinensis TaxID=2607531 RepID=A0A6P7SY66_9MOLL|nr:ribonuclease DdI [Octopus sinensis]XP_036363067.1 ribonuclease DdI [Octopus sinensis]